MVEDKCDAENNDELVGFFLRHLVSVYLVCEDGTNLQNAVVTAFVLSVSNQWFLVTAGHCLRDIDKLINEHGYQITECYLIDSLGLDSQHTEPIPFSYTNANPVYVNDVTNYDYGFIALSPYYRQLLEKNNIEPLDEEVWKLQPPTIDFYVLLGIPGELVKVNSKRVEVAATLHTIIPLEERPEGFSKAEVPLFYGYIEMGEEIASAKGLSGGPVFAFSQDEQGQLRYWLIALQSRWLPNSHYIAACPTKLLGDTLETILEEAMAMHNTG